MKVNVNGSAIVVTSSLKLEDIKTVEKFRPEALTVMGGKDGKEPIFTIGTTNKGEGSISKYGISFAGATLAGTGEACVTLIPTGVPEGKVKEYIADNFGGALMHLKALETSVTAVLAEILAQKQAVMETVTIGQ